MADRTVAGLSSNLADGTRGMTNHGFNESRPGDSGGFDSCIGRRIAECPRCNGIPRSSAATVDAQMNEMLLAARSAGLRYVDPSDPGIRRVRQGRGFRYVDAKGAR